MTSNQPTGDEIDRQWESVHFNKQRMIKAEKALNERQSRFVLGLVKLNAKMMKIAELIITSDHKP